MVFWMPINTQVCALRMEDLVDVYETRRKLVDIGYNFISQLARYFSSNHKTELHLSTQ